MKYKRNSLPSYRMSNIRRIFKPSLFHHFRAAGHSFGWDPVNSDTLDLPAPAPDEQLLSLNDVPTRFADIAPRKAELVHLRYFAGFTFEEAAGVLGIAVPTTKQRWHYARAWLRGEMQHSVDNPTAKHNR